jgi:MFS transporter, AAHS family, 4-hydroxybenzoate transporter
MSEPQIELSELIEGQRFGRFAFLLMVWCSVTMFVEGFEMQMVGYAAPAMIKALHVSKASFGSIFGAGNFGYLLGALLLSSLGDRFGRRRLIIAGVFLFSSFTLAGSYGTTLLELSALRFIAGIGLGGAVPNAIALTIEYAMRGSKATRVSLLYVAYTLGGAGAGLLATKLMPQHGWRIVFAVGGWGGLAMGVLLIFFLPESARFLALNRPDSAILRATLARLRPDVTIAPNTHIQVAESPQHRVPVAALFEDGRKPMTLLLWLAYVTGIMGMQFMTSWLPTLINDTGIGMAQAVFTASLFHIGGTAGNVAMGWLTDRKGIGMIAIGFLIAAPIVALLGPATAAVPLLMAAVLVSGFFIVGSFNGINAVSGMVYPTWMRSTGAGWATGVGRIGSILGPVLGGFLISLSLPKGSLFLCVTITLLVSSCSMGFLSRRSEVVALVDAPNDGRLRLPREQPEGR